MSRQESREPAARLGRLRLAQSKLALELAFLCAAPLLVFFAAALARLALLAAAAAEGLGASLPAQAEPALALAFGTRAPYWGDFAAGCAEACALAGFAFFLAEPFLQRLRRPDLALRPGFLGAPGFERFHGALAFAGLLAAACAARFAADAARSFFTGAAAAPGAFHASGACLANACALFVCAAWAARGSRRFAKLWLFSSALAPEQKLLALSMFNPGNSALCALLPSSAAVLAAACFKHELAENLRLCVPPCAEPAILQNNALYPYIARENPAFANQVLLENKSSLTGAQAEQALGCSLENALLRPQTDPGLPAFLRFFESFSPAQRQGAFCRLALKKAAAGALCFNAFFGEPNGPAALRKSLFESLGQMQPEPLARFENELRRKAAKSCFFAPCAAFGPAQDRPDLPLAHFRCGSESLENILLRAREQSILQACASQAGAGPGPCRRAL